ncbi:MAG TPA: phosphonate ABC transporter, permease protein PhnE [Anaerolineaceae bacterium]|nr:phosphonate ABC transporter, permease protein PhnE [Anaerolineaceae bacterium]
MAAPEDTLISGNKTLIPTIASLLIPGSGQAFLGSRWKGLVILLTTAVLTFLVNWALVNLNIGQVNIGKLVTSWLWIPLILFWVWNVLDAQKSSEGKTFTPLIGLMCAGLILYFIAWNVTDVNLDRLVTRFGDAQKMANQLINPELATVTINGQDQTCSWDCLFGYTRDRIAGIKPHLDVKASQNVLDIFGQTQKAAAPAWMVFLGFAQKGQQVNTFVAGKLMETIAIGLMSTLFSTILAVPISFLAAHNIMSRIPGGQAIYYITRTILNIVRAVDTIVWGLIVIVWVGLGTFAGVIALTIHSVAALAKLYSEELEHIDPGPVEAVTATGANLFQTIRYGVVPQITPSFLAYTLLRWDINMRSATVIGFVAGGGIGFLVVETIRAGAYQFYAMILWATAVVIILVDYISAKMRENILKDQPPQKIKTQNQQTFGTLRKVFYIIIGLVLFAYCWNLTEISLPDLFSPAPTLISMVSDFVHIDLTADVVAVVTQQMLITIFQALLATTLGAIIALPFSFLAARNLTGKNKMLIWIYYLTRSIFNVLRSIEALLYVAIFIFWVGIGPFAGMLALAVTTFALIGKLFSEAIENIESGSIEAVTATGAGPLQVINYAILPQIVPAFVSYLIYQWDINIRMATIIGFAGGGGIGLTLSTYFGSLQYHKAGTVVAFIVIVVALMDFSSAKLRQQLV